MDGLENQAEREVRLLVDRLYKHNVLEIKHSSRDCLIEQITEVLLYPFPVVTRTLVFRSGLSSNSLRLLQTVLKKPDSPIRELEFISLRTEEEVEMALACCQVQPKIERVRLENYRSLGRVGREDRQSIAQTLRRGIFGAEHDNGGCPLPHVTCVEIVGFPIGSVGAQILSEAMVKNSTIETLRLMDCDLRSDSIFYIAQMIRGNTRLRELDLSYNRHYLESPITRELTIKTLVNKGLKYNYTLHRLGLRQTRGEPVERSKIDQLLSVNRFCYDFRKNQRDPFNVPEAVWPHVIARVTAKPSVLNQFLRDSATALFGS